MSVLKTVFISVFTLIISCLAGIDLASAQPFTGEKSSWHGFDRYDFIMDEQTLELTPIKATPEEGNNAKAPEKGTRRCIVIVPEKAAAGNPWTWRGCYWDHEPQAEIELLKRGFHVAYITTDPDRTWDAWYEFLTQKHGLSPKPSFIGMSRGGSNAYTWGTNNPDKVTAIYADNPAIQPESLLKLGLLAENDVPLLNVCGSVDPIIYYTVAIENMYHNAGGRISVFLKDGTAHHPHSLRNPKLIADFIENSYNEKPVAVPDFLPQRYSKEAYYSTERKYNYDQSEKVYVSTWGPLFNGNYYKYMFGLPGIRMSVTVLAPEKSAEGMPWVYRADALTRNSLVDFALLAKGYHIVVGPVPTDVDGPVVEKWNEVYDYLVSKGFSAKPVMAGCGGAAGEVYNWAIENPDKVSCIYGENPVMRSSLAKIQPMDNLTPLAKADIPLIHVCGELDPAFESQTGEVEKRYKQLGGEITVIVDKNKGRYPYAPSDVEKVVDLIVKNTR